MFAFNVLSARVVKIELGGQQKPMAAAAAIERQKVRRGWGLLWKWCILQCVSK